MAVSNTLADPIAAAGSAPAGTAPTGSEKETTERMATAIVTLAREYGVVTIPALIARGFSQDEIDRLGDRARAKARPHLEFG